jgi:RNA polymerase sigma factor (sigma-70 family)
VATNRTGKAMDQLVLALRTREMDRLTDGQLLRQFLAQRDEAAFAALVRRHSPMVHGVCRRVLANDADAQDAFQATFLVLVRKARALKSRAVLGDWLHGVARRTALKAKGAAARRRIKERAVARTQGQCQRNQNAWLPLLDEELSGLPEKYRLPIILCELEGKTRQEAARHLGWPEGTVAGRLARARLLLAKRLLARGVVLPGGALTAAFATSGASACVPPTLVHSTIKAATLVAAGETAAEGVISAKVAVLTGEVMKAMLLSKLKNVAVVLVACVLGGFGWVGYGSLAQEQRDHSERAARPRVADKGLILDTDSKQDALNGKTENDTPTANSKEDPISAEKHAFDTVVSRLAEPIETRNFQNPMILRDLTALVYEMFDAKQKAFTIILDSQAFREEDPQLDIQDCRVTFPAFPRVITTAGLLEIAIGQIPSVKAQILIRGPIVYITTQKRASVGNLLQERVCARFENMPFADVLEKLAGLTGVSITLDPRVGEKAKTPVSATFRNDVTLGGALRTVTDMAGLKVVDMKSSLYVTTPDNAKELEKELREVKQ